MTCCGLRYNPSHDRLIGSKLKTKVTETYMRSAESNGIDPLSLLRYLNKTPYKMNQADNDSVYSCVAPLMQKEETKYFLQLKSILPREYMFS